MLHRAPAVLRSLCLVVGLGGALGSCAESDGVADVGLRSDASAVDDLAGGGGDLRTSCDLGVDGGSGEALFVTATTSVGQPWAALRTGGSWGSVPVGGAALSALVATGIAGRPVLVGRQTDDALVSAIYDPCGMSFGAPASLFPSALTAERPAAIGGALVDLVFRGSVSGDQRLYHARFDGSWHSATALGNFLSTLPPIALRANGAVHAIFTGTDGTVYDGLVDNNGGAATPIAVAGSDRGPAAESAADGTTWVVYKASDTNLMWSVRTSGGGYAAPQPLCAGQIMPCLIASNESPAVSLDRGGALLAAWIGKDDGVVYTSRLPAGDTVWTAPLPASPEPTALVPALAPGLSGFDLELVYVRASDGKGRHARLSAGGFSVPTDLPGPALGSRPSLISLGGP